MTDQIEISAIRTVAIVGALPHEREIPQPLQIDLTLDVDLGDAGRSDDLDDTVHYGWVADQVVAVVSEPPKPILRARLVKMLFGLEGASKDDDDLVASASGS